MQTQDPKNNDILRLTLTTKFGDVNLQPNMEETTEMLTDTNTVKPRFWRNLFNLKVALNAGIVWLGLICQDIYAQFGWISTNSTISLGTQVLRWLIVLILLYATFLVLSYLAKRPALKSLYHKKIAYIVLVIWVVMNVSCYQLLYFGYFARIRVYLLKLMHLLALYALVLTITRLIQRWHESKVKHQLIFTAVFCIGGWIFLLLTFPGAYRADDILIVNNAGYYYLTPWQHLFTGIFHVLCLQTIPFVFGVIFIQILLNALMFGYCVVTLGHLFSKTPRQALILEIVLSFVFMLPPVLNYTLSGYRVGIYQFIEVFLLTRLIYFFYRKEQKISWLNLFEIIFFTMVVGTWRTENFYYPFVVLAVLLLFGKDRLNRTLAFIAAGIALIGILGVNFINTKHIGDNGYTIVSTFTPVCAIIREADDLDDATLVTLDKVIDVEFVKANPDKNGSHIFFHGGYRSNYSQAEYRAYLGAAAKIILQHPEIAMKCWSTNFQKTVGINTKRKTPSSSLPNTITNFTDPTSNCYWFDDELHPYINRSYFHNPINSTLRNQVIAWLNGIELDNNTLSYNITPAYHIFYNLVIPSILFFIATLVIIFCRRWFLLLPCAAILCHLIIVFFTAPAGTFFYYLPTYLCMYVFAIAFIWFGVCSLIGKFHKK